MSDPTSPTVLNAHSTESQIFDFLRIQAGVVIWIEKVRF
jgi:hypothetical protein